MKKLYLIAALAIATLSANAQEKLYLSTYNGTNIERFDGKVCDVTVNRYIFNGWNTISLPFALSQDELNEYFGDNCRLEKLVGAEQSGQAVVLNFQDCKAEGLQANTPYILYYSGENCNKKIVKAATVSDSPSALTYNIKGSAETVTMGGTKTHIDGKGFYGILARDNAQAQFVKVDDTTNGFYATRCYVALSTDKNVKLITNHTAFGQTAAIDAVASASERVDVYTTSGVRVATQVRASEAGKTLQPGIYVVKGQKILIK